MLVAYWLCLFIDDRSIIVVSEFEAESCCNLLFSINRLQTAATSKVLGKLAFKFLFSINFHPPVSTNHVKNLQLQLNLTHHCSKRRNGKAKNERSLSQRRRAAAAAAAFTAPTHGVCAGVGSEPGHSLLTVAVVHVVRLLLLVLARAG